MLYYCFMNYSTVVSFVCWHFAVVICFVVVSIVSDGEPFNVAHPARFPVGNVPEKRRHFHNGQESATYCTYLSCLII